MFEDILKLHRQIYYGVESFKHEKRDINPNIAPNYDFIKLEKSTSKIGVSEAENYKSPARNTPDWIEYIEPVEVSSLEILSDELEFHARRYGGGLL